MFVASAADRIVIPFRPNRLNGVHVLLMEVVPGRCKPDAQGGPEAKKSFVAGSHLLLRCIRHVCCEQRAVAQGRAVGLQTLLAPPTCL